MSDLDFIPFDSACFAMLEGKFQHVFESKLIDEICQNSRMKSYSSNKILVDVGNSISYLPLLISGSIKVMTEDTDGNELLLYYLEAGETCAMTLNCCTMEAKSTIRAITETECTILLVQKHKMDDFMIKYKSWRSYILSSFNERLNEMVQAFDNVVFSSLNERLIRYLREKVEIAGNNVLSISHQNIADDLYTTRVSISRLMRKLEANKYIEQQRNKVILLDNYSRKQ